VSSLSIVHAAYVYVILRSEQPSSVNPYTGFDVEFESENGVPSLKDGRKDG
jgi:hypothetical protein